MYAFAKLSQTNVSANVSKRARVRLKNSRSNSGWRPAAAVAKIACAKSLSNPACVPQAAPPRAARRWYLCAKPSLLENSQTSRHRPLISYSKRLILVLTHASVRVWPAAKSTTESAKRPTPWLRLGASVTFLSQNIDRGYNQAYDLGRVDCGDGWSRHDFATPSFDLLRYRGSTSSQRPAGNGGPSRDFVTVQRFMCALNLRLYSAGIQ